MTAVAIAQRADEPVDCAQHLAGRVVEHCIDRTIRVLADGNLHPIELACTAGRIPRCGIGCLHALLDLGLERAVDAALLLSRVGARLAHRLPDRAIEHALCRGRGRLHVALLDAGLLEPFREQRLRVVRRVEQLLLLLLALVASGVPPVAA